MAPSAGRRWPRRWLSSAFVQLLILIGNWRRSAPVEAAELAHVPPCQRPVGIGADQAGSRRRPLEDQGGRAADDQARFAHETAPVPMRSARAARRSRQAGCVRNRPPRPGQLDLHLEPLVELAASSTVYYRSSLALTRHDGGRVGPYLLSLSAGQDGFASALDLALFRRVCPVIRHLKGRAPPARRLLSAVAAVLRRTAPCWTNSSVSEGQRGCRRRHGDRDFPVGPRCPVAGRHGGAGVGWPNSGRRCR
jgi:hypothetical protein